MILSSMLGAGWVHGPKVLWDDEGILLCRAFREGKIPDAMSNDRYYNVRTLKKLKAA